MSKTKDEIVKLKEEIKELKFRLDHPPKFKPGDEVAGMKIVDVKLSKRRGFKVVSGGWGMTLQTPPTVIVENVYTCYDANKNKIVELSELELIEGWLLGGYKNK